MSIYTHIATSRPLPLGQFATPPDVVYDNYDAYRRSKDYVKPEAVGIPAVYKLDRKLLYETDCPVHVYHTSTALHGVRIDEYIDPTTISPSKFGYDEANEKDEKVLVKFSMEEFQQAMFDQVVDGQFTLPYIYCLGMLYSEKALRDCLCAYLEPGDKAELYECWAQTEREERDKSWDQIVDLQDYMDNGNLDVPTTEYAEKTEKRFVTYLAPSTGHATFNYVDNQDSIDVYADIREESIPFSLAEKLMGGINKLQ